MENGGRTRTRSPSLAMESDTQTLYAKGEAMIKEDYERELARKEKEHLERVHSRNWQPCKKLT